ncbi:MAG: dihydrofolate reductase family protein [Nocardioidaceae bacterium]
MSTQTRTLSVELFSTLDGFASGTESEGYFGLYGPDLEAWIGDVATPAHVMVMGRKTYVELAGIVAGGGDPWFARMNELPKLVFSSTLEEPLSWENSTLVRDDAATALATMKAEPGDPFRVVGSLSMLPALLTAGLVDRLKLVVFPRVLGTTGTAPIFTGLPDLDLRLVDTQVLDSRLVLLDYVPQPPRGSEGP